MSIGFIFWLMMLLWILFGAWGYWNPNPRWWYGHGLFFFILFFLLGWKVFGFIVHA